MQRKRTLLREIIHNKTWKGNLQVIRGYPPTKRGSSDLILGTSKRSNSDVIGENLTDQKAEQADLKPLNASLTPVPTHFSPTGDCISQIYF
jgi:hypothetical protein